MKAIKTLRAFFFFLFFSNILIAQEFPARPNPPRLVNDFANLLTNQEKNQLENKLVAYNDSTSTQIAIVILNSIGNYDAGDYSFKLAQQWGIGQKGKNNGLLLLVVKESRDVFIATGYGLEEYVTDATAKTIIEQYIIPDFKQKYFYKGLDKGIDLIIQSLSGKFEGGGNSPKPIKMIFIILGIIVLILFQIFRWRGGYRSYGRYGGGYWGGGSSSGSGGSSFGGFGGGSFGGGGAGGKW